MIGSCVVPKDSSPPPGDREKASRMCRKLITFSSIHKLLKTTTRHKIPFILSTRKPRDPSIANGYVIQSPRTSPCIKQEIHVYVCVCIYISIHECVYIYTHYIYTCMYACIYIYIYIYIYIHAHTYVYMDIHEPTNNKNKQKTNT